MFDCCNPHCEPCCIPYGQSLNACSGAEIEAIPQNLPPPPQTAPAKKKPYKIKKRIIPFLMEPRARIMFRLPKTRIVKKIKADIAYSTWECCKRNGIQDEVPQWLVLGRPYCRPGPSYRNKAVYYPSCNQCCNQYCPGCYC